MKKLILFILTLLLSFQSIYSIEKEYRCGIALGYPPYQYQDKQGNTAGLDYEVTKLVFENAGLKVKFVQKSWDEVLFGIMHKNGVVNVLCGAEISSEREVALDFSIPYYSRNIVIFALKDSEIKELSDLYGKVITGDRHSFVEREIGEDKDKIRIIQTISKEDSFLKLKQGKVVAVVAPLEVGNYLAKTLDIEVKVISQNDFGSPVAFAVEKGNKELLKILNKSLEELIKNGSIEKILKKY